MKPQLILELKTISLVHYAPEILEPGEFRAVVNGPHYLNLVVSTKPGDRAETAENPKTQYYLMYLRRRDDGAFEPVSGHLDPDFSVWKLGRAR